MIRPNYTADLVRRVGEDNIGADGELPPYAWPGGYAIAYYDAENNVLCSRCASRDAGDPFDDGTFDKQDMIIGCDILEGEGSEDEHAYCDDCGLAIDYALRKQD